jgi:hypothetical protein
MPPLSFNPQYPPLPASPPPLQVPGSDDEFPALPDLQGALPVFDITFDVVWKEFVNQPRSRGKVLHKGFKCRFNQYSQFLGFLWSLCPTALRTRDQSANEATKRAAQGYAVYNAECSEVTQVLRTMENGFFRARRRDTNRFFYVRHSGHTYTFADVNGGNAPQMSKFSDGSNFFFLDCHTIIKSLSWQHSLLPKRFCVGGNGKPLSLFSFPLE